jgi:hypothetical protein
MRRIMVLLSLASLALGGCSGGETINLPETSTDIELAEVVDVIAVTEVVDLASPDLLNFDLETTPPKEEEVFVPCEAGEGCFLDPCEDNDECLSGFCVDHLGEGVCSIECQEECPPGWTCESMGSGPDVLFACISQMTNLCRPCRDSNDCKAPGGAEDVCVSYGEEGAFCGGECATDGDCPWGFSCLTTVTVDGIGTLQCAADAGVCPCTAKSVTLSLWTNCEVTNEFGSCPGKRVCTEEGLSDCDAEVPTTELCDGLDNDCDGDIDEPGLFEGKLVELCDDENDCTEDACKGVAGCSYAAQSGIECVDGNPCTVADHCEEGVCAGSTVDCDDSNVCTDDSCDETGGCVFVANSAKCDDEDPCTVADQCEAEECGGVAVDCQCMTDEDCVALEDGDVCNGTLVCDTAKLPHLCVVKPNSTITCGDPEGVDAPCLKSACDPVSGECSFAPKADDIPCNNGNACTLNDSCLAGKCAGGAPANCNDGNPCTDDSCDGVEGCSSLPNDGECDDNNPCTDGDHCSEGACIPVSLVDCDDNNPCTQDLCNMNGGCVHNIVAGACSDSNPCTLNDQCINGACAPGPSPDCNDDNPCTDDSCGEDGACLHLANSGQCDDGNECTAGDHCAGGKCAFEDAVMCDDGNVCTTDSCTPVGGCSYTLNEAPCDDEDVCTTGDHCHLGGCISSGELSCEDSNACTDDSCEAATGCQFAPNEAACDDGNVCTENDSCQSGQCKAGTPLDCDDENFCTNDSCVQGEGCLHSDNALPCDDGNECTLGEACVAGKCLGGAAPNCDDAELCTDDSCDPNSGCTHVNNSVACEDGSVCTVGDICTNGDCTPGGPLDCDDQLTCTVDACHPDNGCVHGADDALCGDDNECTSDLCSLQDGCSNPAVADNTACGDGTWKCLGGVCKEKLPCDGGWAYKGRCWYQGPVMSSNNCPTCDTICSGHGGCHQASLNTEGWDQSCSACKATGCPGCGCQDGPGNIAAHEAAPMHNGSTCEYTDHGSYPPICGMNHCNSSVYGRRRLCACNENP